MTTPTDHLYPIILAGGTGTRLWPRSRRGRPKQLLDLLSARTMLQQTYERIAPLVQSDHVFVITNRAYVGETAAQLPELPASNVIGEPEGRGTAPPIGYAAALLAARDPDAVMVILPADHFISKDDDFRQAICAAERVAEQDLLVTFGIQPSFPETGYGYIESGEDLPPALGYRARKVCRFVEKPSQETAAEYVASGDYYWNSGMFIWRARVILEEFARYLPEHLRLINEIISARGRADAAEVFARNWLAMGADTIDYAIMEKSERVAVIPLDVGWSDVGNWATLLDLLPGDGNQNVIIGDHIGIETSSCLIYTNDRLIATVGIEDMIVVDTGDVVLVCHKEDAQKVKHLVEELKRSKQEKYL